jgi:hypothetical protein
MLQQPRCPPYAGAYPWRLICQFDIFWDCPIFSSGQSQKGSCCLFWVFATSRSSVTIPQRHMASKQQRSLCLFGPQQLPSDNAAKATFMVVIICLCLNPCRSAVRLCTFGAWTLDMLALNCWALIIRNTRHDVC